MKKFFSFNKIMALSAVFFPLMVAQPSYATGEESKGKTTCYVFKNNKLAKKSACNYVHLEYGSIRYNENTYKFNIPKYGKIEAGSSLSAKTDEQGELIEGSEGSVVYNDSTTTINNKPAFVYARTIKDLKPVNEKSYQNYLNGKKMSVSPEKSWLSCMSSDDEKLEICIPLKDGAFY